MFLISRLEVRNHQHCKRLKRSLTYRTGGKKHETQKVGAVERSTPQARNS